MKKELREAIDFWDGYGVQIEWFVNAAGDEAIGIGANFAWSVRVDEYGRMHTSEAALGEWNTGFEI